MTELIVVLRNYDTMQNGSKADVLPEGTADRAADALEAAEKRIAEAVAILQTIEWVGSGAKGKIEDAISVLLGIQEDTE